VPEPGNAPMIPPPDGEADAKATKPAAAPEAKATESKPVTTKAPEKTEAAKAPATARIYLQIAALGSEPAARDLAARLKKAGHTAMVEKVDTKDGARWRVRVGPFANREEADQARTKLRAAGFQANAVTS
jgi:DedD protein